MSLVPINYIDRGRFKEIIRNDKMLFLCPFCDYWFKGLAYHTRQKHGVSSKRLKQIMGLKYNYQLITPELKERHRIIAIEHNEGEKLKIVGQNTRYIKGSKGHIKENWSLQARDKNKPI